MAQDRRNLRTAVPGAPPVLASRLSPAALPEPVVLRPRLARLLDEAVARPVTLLRAPAGWGKTTVLASWRQAVTQAGGAGPAWVSVEAGDDADRLWAYLAAALRSSIEADPTATPIPDRPPGPDELEVLAAALAAREQPVVLILDDLHRVTDPAAVTGLEFLLRHTDQRLRLVMAGRHGPPLAVQRLRLAGELTEIGREELAFTGDEIADLLTAHGAAVPVAAVRRLRQRTEGWPAALRIAALALRQQSDPQRWIDQLGADQPEIAGYLREEVLAGLAPQDRELLRRAAVADTVCVGLAGALTGNPAVEERLSALAEDAGLLHHDGGSPAWYRCHPLLADLLHRELARLPAEELRDLHLSAQGWYADNGRPAEALRHALAAQDWITAVDVFVTRWPELVPAGRGDRSGPPPPAPPPEAVTRDPELALACAVERALHGDREAAETRLRLAAEPARRLPEPRRTRYRRLAAAADLALARLTDNPAAVRTAATRLLATSSFKGGVPGAQDAGAAVTASPRALDAPEPAAGVPRTADSADVAAVAGAELARLALEAGELTEAAQGFEGALSAARVAGRLRPELVCASRGALLAALRGNLRAAEEMARAALALPPCQGWSAPLDCGYAYLALGLVALCRDQPAEAAANLTLAAAATGDPPVGAVAAWCQSLLSRDEGDLGQAHRLLVAARECWSPRTGPLAARLLAADLELHAARGDLATARELAAGAMAQVSTPGRDESTAVLAVAAARVELRAGDPHAAARLLPDWAAGTAADWPLPVRLDAALLDAVLAATEGDHRRAGRILEQALDLAAPDGHRRSFLRAEPGLRDLLAAHLDAGTAHWPMVSDLVRAVDTPAESTTSGTSVAAALDEPLTERELTILRYLQSILSNVEIAAELSVSVNTVKTHVRNIYRKLDATRRRDAVRRARELHLI
ncbi:LuxR C-terminal-related transcriptional regulator [Micromonospora sp. NPDC048871]|uniref:helix-turn-helix transcriptional regulator n=1 Tax=unclassified Micromonospora TaxID=2617518 RepID=UPI002E117D6C|nr:LuxR C-terminal-related transcriptional regulator [Micromonospora sp. NBC_01739]